MFNVKITAKALFESRVGLPTLLGNSANPTKECCQPYSGILPTLLPWEPWPWFNGVGPRIGASWAAGHVYPEPCFGSSFGPDLGTEKCPQSGPILDPKMDPFLDQLLGPNRLPKKAPGKPCPAPLPRPQTYTPIGHRDGHTFSSTYLQDWSFTVHIDFQKLAPGMGNNFLEPTCRNGHSQCTLMTKKMHQGWATLFLNPLVGMVTHSAH
jgi:hypothetical protein